MDDLTFYFTFSEYKYRDVVPLLSLFENINGSLADIGSKEFEVIKTSLHIQETSVKKSEIFKMKNHAFKRNWLLE
jgi:hypothetical protein